jgi:alpha-galactosidase
VSGPRIAIVGGGSYQWVPKLLVDVANTPSLAGAEIVLEDIDPAPLPRMAAWVEHIAERRELPLTVRTTTDQRDALTGADFVVVTISTGGFESMRQDLEVPRRYGIEQSVGDSVGPGGICRTLRNVPVFLALAADMAECCPDAWLLNITNPMTTICRAVTRETPIKTVGLCHEVTLTRFTLAMLLDADFREIDLEVTGVNHLPIVTRATVGGQDGFARLHDLLEHEAERGHEPLPMAMPEGLGHEKISEGGDWTRGDLLAANRVKLELFRRFGALPAAGDRHLVEFFPGFLTEESGWGERWGVHLTSIENREWWQGRHVEEFEAMLAAPEISTMPSGELVAALIDSMLRDRPRDLPLNLPNAGQCPDLPDDVVVESMCTVDGAGIRGRDRAVAPPPLAEHLRRVAAAQELTVEAAVSGDRDAVFAALLADPLAGRIDYERLDAMTDDLVAATARWLPQFG